MIVSYFPKKISNKTTTLVLGGFNAFHNGHYELLKTALKHKKPISFMIVEHPEKINTFASLKTRLNHLASLGVSYVSIVKLTKEQKRMTGNEFLKKMVESTKANHIVLGKDFKCGKNRSYGAQDIVKDFEATIVEHKKINSTKISTSLLRELVTTGEMDLIKKISPFYYEINAHISPKLSFEFNDYIIPQKGVYAVKVHVNEIEYWGIAHIGFKFNKIFVPDLRIKNSGFDCKILFVKLFRKIFATKYDFLSEEDKILVGKYLSTF